MFLINAAGGKKRGKKGKTGKEALVGEIASHDSDVYRLFVCLFVAQSVRTL